MREREREREGGREREREREREGGREILIAMQYIIAIIMQYLV